MILVLAGTTEGREAAVALERQGQKVITATATAYGGELLKKDFKGEISDRPLNTGEMLQFIERRGITRVIDATHPFAVEVSVNARAACRKAGIIYERLERESLEAEAGEGVIIACNSEEAVQLAASAEGSIFLTVGSSKLEQYTAGLNPQKLVVRILPVERSLKKCLDLGIPPKNIIAMQGPFSEEINRALFRRFGPSLVITKESGSTGGTAEKISAARALSIPIVLIARPTGAQ